MASFGASNTGWSKQIKCAIIYSILTRFAVACVQTFVEEQN